MDKTNENSAPSDATKESSPVPSQTEKGKIAANKDPNVVDWDGPDDPANPLNWPGWKTGINCLLISMSTFVTPLASSMFAPGVPTVMEDFQSDNDLLAAFVVSVYVLGFAAGPMAIAPLSEIYGRVPVYHVCNVGFIAFLVACALAPSLNSLIAFRFLCGLFGSCPITNGGGSIGDMVRQEKRGVAMSGFAMGPLLGPIIGPVAGGFLTAAKGWRWTFWVLAILGGVVAIAEVVLLSETYAPVLLNRKAKQLQKETGNMALRSKLDNGSTPRELFKHTILRPFRMLAFSPIIIITTIYIAVVYGYLYIMFTSVTEVFEETYGFSTQIVGLVFIGLGVGSVAGVVYFSMTSDPYIRKKLAEAAGEEIPTRVKPEFRLPAVLVGSVVMPAGFFVYGWTAQFHVHWIVPIIGTAIIGAGNMLNFMSVTVYLVDAFTIHAASALAANTVVRSVAGAVLPLCGLQMYAVLGLGWGNSLLGFIAIAGIPAVIGLMRKGEWLRTKYELKDV
ncbi:putative bicyclomycin resistance protein [Mycena metata]|uniref:Bicyclomycin resistance protein n=1 Tax=Mycena metata TaxID=1033252 RepID=A0AAD7MQQ2_9AGAR|nr:putative bicyclomycin resistance protein [Mycena metata]